MQLKIRAIIPIHNGKGTIQISTGQNGRFQKLAGAYDCPFWYGNFSSCLKLKCFFSPGGILQWWVILFQTYLCKCGAGPKYEEEKGPQLWPFGLCQNHLALSLSDMFWANSHWKFLPQICCCPFSSQGMQCRGVARVELSGSCRRSRQAAAAHSCWGSQKDPNSPQGRSGRDPMVFQVKVQKGGPNTVQPPAAQEVWAKVMGQL